MKNDRSQLMWAKNRRLKKNHEIPKFIKTRCGNMDQALNRRLKSNLHFQRFLTKRFDNKQQASNISRELSKKRKILNKEEEEVKMPRQVPKRTNEENRTMLSVPRTVEKPHNFKELDRDLFVVDETEKISSGAFGRCFTIIYRIEYRVVVKEMKVKDS